MKKSLEFDILEVVSSGESHLSMIYNFIALTVIIGCGVVIFLLLRKKYHQLRLIDVQTIAEEKEDQVKERILLDRMKRRAQSGSALAGKVFSPVGSIFKNTWKKISTRLADWESKLQKQATKTAANKIINFDQQVKNLLTEAQELFKKEELAEAEKRFIEIIGLDPHNRAAFEGLANLYEAQKEYQQSLQTVLHILKLDKHLSKTVTKDDGKGGKFKTVDNADQINEDYLWIGQLYQSLNDMVKANEYYAMAIELTPNDPKTLDLLINSAIILHNKSQAFDYVKRLEETNPENQKVIEYKKKIEEM